MKTVLTVNFDVDSANYEALTVLKELDGQGQIHLTGAAVVSRQEDGRVLIKDAVGNTGRTKTGTGGIIGLLVGILGGPFGILLGGATGLLIGSLFDIEDAEEVESVLESVSRSVAVGRIALLAEVDETSPDVIDAAMVKLGGRIDRQSLDEVEAEIAAAEDAQRRAKREARKHLHEQRRAHAGNEIQAKIQELEAKLHAREAPRTESA
jgi:uncharacterized membrane protein